MAKAKKAGLTATQRSRTKKVAKILAEALEIVESLDEDGAEAEAPDEDEVEETPAQRRKRLREEKKSGKKDKDDDDPTIDDVREILTKVIEEFDNKEAEILLKDFGAKRASDLDKGDFAKFIKACNDLLDEDDD